MAKVWNRFKRWPIQFGVALLLVGALARPAAAGTTYNVSSVAELETAIAAVNAGTGGDTIVLAPVTFAIANQLVITQDVTIQGDPVWSTVVDGGGLPSVFWLKARNVAMLNLTIQNAGSGISWDSVGIFTGTGLTITGNRNGLNAGDAEGEIFLTNSTIANNDVGILISCPSLHVTNDTVAGNGIGVRFYSTCNNLMQLTNALIVANTSDCGGNTTGFTAAGTASIDSDGSCVSRGFGPGLATVALPLVGLAPLAANGGPTLTAGIPATSAAVNAGSNSACPATDQRGFLRNDGFCDIGAFEYGASLGGGNTPASTGPVSVSPVPGVTVTFPSVVAGGDTTAITGGPAPPPGFQVDGLVYDITTTATLPIPVIMTVCLPFNAGAHNPVPHLFHFETSAIPPLPLPLPPFPRWVDRTTFTSPTDHVVCGDVSSLSPFAVLIPPDVAGQLQQLQGLIDNFNLRKPVARRFTHRLDDVRRAWFRHHRHKDTREPFCEELREFIANVQRQSRKTLTAGEAGQLLALAQLIAEEVGCGD